MTGLTSLISVPLAIFIIGGEEPAYWDWQLTEPLDLSVRVSILVTDMDGVTARQVADLKVRDIRPMCYISVGSHEDYRDDASTFPAHVLGNPLGDWPGETYLDTRAPEVLEIMKARVDRCAEMGFVGIEADNIDAYENDNGFGLSQTDALRYVGELADYTHSKGLVIAQKNAPELVPFLVDKMDFLMLEQCFEYAFCAEAQPYLDAKKDVLVIEYTQARLEWDEICAQAKRLGVHLLLKDAEIAAGGKACTE